MALLKGGDPFFKLQDMDIQVLDPAYFPETPDGIQKRVAAAARIFRSALFERSPGGGYYIPGSMTTKIAAKRYLGVLVTIQVPDEANPSGSLQYPNIDTVIISNFYEIPPLASVKLK
jgi:hypothetical protein